MTKKNQKKLLFGLIGILVVFAIIFLYLIMFSDNKLGEKISPIQITLRQDNFAFVKSSYLNAQQYSSPDCSSKGKLGCETMEGEKFDCPNPDLLTLYLKVLNLNEGVTHYSLEYKDLLVCDIQDGESKYAINQHFYHNEQTGLSEMGPLILDYSKSHNLVICCKIQDSNVNSNEICLDNIKIASLC